MDLLWLSRAVERRSGRLAGAGRRFRARGAERPPLPPLLEEAHALAATVGPPQVAAARGRVATVPGAVVAVPTAADARTPENVHQRRSSETTSLKTSLSFRATEIFYGTVAHEITNFYELAADKST